MKVIMLEDVKKVGKKNEVVEVSDGYAQNFLIKNKLAVFASKAAMDVLNGQKDLEKKHQQKLRKEALELQEILKKEEFVFEVKAKDGRVSGSISTKQLEEALAKKGYNIDKRKIIDQRHLNTLGYNLVKVELYKDVIGEIKVLLKEKNEH